MTALFKIQTVEEFLADRFTTKELAYNDEDLRTLIVHRDGQWCLAVEELKRRIRERVSQLKQDRQSHAKYMRDDNTSTDTWAMAFDEGMIEAGSSCLEIIVEVFGSVTK